MPSMAQLKTRGEQLRALMTEINESDKTPAEKSEATKALHADFTEWKAQCETARQSEEMQKAFGGGDGEAPEVHDVDDLEVFVPNLGRSREDLFKNLMRHPSMKHLIDGLKNGSLGDGETKNFEVATRSVVKKDATSTGNLVGEGLYGASGVSYAGQNPFLPGAFGPAIMPNFLPGVVDLRFYQLTIADLIPSIATDSPNLSYLVEATRVTNAAPTAENALYPFSSSTFSRVYEQVGKIANAGVLTDEVVQDTPELYNFFLGTIVDGILRQEEVQLLAGSGLPGVNGLLNRSTGFTKPQTITAVTNWKFPANGTLGAGVLQGNIASLTYGRKVAGTGTSGTAATAVQIAEGIYQATVDIQTGTQFFPNAIIMSPLDWETIRLGKDNNGQYYNGSWSGSTYGNGQGNPMSLWGIPVVISFAMPQGTILTGYFGPESIRAARRKGVTLETTNSNVDDFVNGRVTVRAQERVGLMVHRPSVFELIQVVPAP